MRAADIQEPGEPEREPDQVDSQRIGRAAGGPHSNDPHRRGRSGGAESVPEARGSYVSRIGPLWKSKAPFACVLIPKAWEGAEPSISPRLGSPEKESERETREIYTLETLSHFLSS